MICRACGQCKEMDQFSPQKTNPKRLYAWCDDCREMSKTTGVRPNIGFLSENKAMREKAISLRKFDNATAIELARRHKAGETKKALAEEYKVSGDTISRAIKRGHRAEVQDARRRNRAG